MPVYDDQKQKGGSGNPLVPDDGQLRQITGVNKEQEKAHEHGAYSGAAHDIAEREGLATAHSGKASAAKSVGTDKLRADEKSAGESLYREEKPSRRQRVTGGLLYGASSASGGKGKAKGKLKKKALLVGGSLAGLGIGAIIIAIIFIVGILKIPDYANHILAYQFSRVSRTFAEDDLQVTAEDAALQSAEDGGTSILASFGNLKDNVIQKFQKLSPQAVVDNLQGDGTLKYNYEPSKVLGIKQLKSITINGGQTIDVSSATASNFSKLLHPIDTLTGGPQIASELSPALQSAIRDPTGVIIRGLVENNIRKELGISLLAWVIGKYQGKSPQQADDQQEADAFKTVDEPGTEPSVVGTIGKAETDEKQTENKDVNSPAGLKTIEANGGIDANADTAAESDLNDLCNGWSDFLGTINPLFKIAVPLCIIYDGSIDSPNTSSSIDAQDNEDQRAFYLTSSAADQQKYGNTTAEAVGAFNWKLGDITESNPELRSAGIQPNTLNTSIAPQASPDGEYTILSALLPSALASALDSGASTLCPPLTNPVVAGIGAAIAIAAAIASGGGDDLPVAPAEAAANTLNEDLGDVTAATVASEGANTVIGGLLSKAFGFFNESAGAQAAGVGDKIAESLGLTKTGAKTLAGLTAATLAARAITFSKANTVSNGLSVGADFDNQADAGGNINANEDERQQFYGVAMNNSQTAAAQQEDKAYIADEVKSEPAMQRYFAVDNPNSLISEVATDIAVRFNGATFSSILRGIGEIFNPVRFISDIASLFNSHVALAQSDSSPIDTQDYGVVQWGWPQSEESLINSDPSYQPLENAQVFTQEANDYANANGGADLGTAIQNMYGQCFTGSMGSLLAGSSSPAIQRDSNGNVTGGICSENGTNGTNGLGPSNNEFGSQAVFRWRLLQAYNATLDQLTQVQDYGSAS
jgi:hypothetical protein